MNIRELSQVKEKNVIYDESIGVAYNVLKIYNSGILTYWEWTNSYGKFAENIFFKNKELLCKDMILL